MKCANVHQKRCRCLTIKKRVLSQRKWHSCNYGQGSADFADFAVRLISLKPFKFNHCHSIESRSIATQLIVRTEQELFSSIVTWVSVPEQYGQFELNTLRFEEWESGIRLSSFHEKDPSASEGCRRFFCSAGASGTLFCFDIVAKVIKLIKVWWRVLVLCLSWIFNRQCAWRFYRSSIDEKWSSWLFKAKNFVSRI